MSIAHCIEGRVIWTDNYFPHTYSTEQLLHSSDVQFIYKQICILNPFAVRAYFFYFNCLQPKISFFLRLTMMYFLFSHRQQLYMEITTLSEGYLLTGPSETVQHCLHIPKLYLPIKPQQAHSGLLLHWQPLAGP